MISRRRARETPRIYSSCIRTHTSILHINRCIYDVARDTTTLRRRRVLQFRSSPFSSLLFSFLSFSFSLPFLLDPCTGPSLDGRSTDSNSNAIARISSPSFLFTLFPSFSSPLVSQSSCLRLIRLFLSHRYTCFRARIRRVSPHSFSLYLFLSYRVAIYPFLSLSPLLLLSFFS